MQITTEEELRALYGWPKGRAKEKVLPKLEKHAQHFLLHSPFFVLSTYAQDGRADASPRGGKPGFVKVWDEQYLNPFPEEQNPPKSCLLIEIQEVFLHCAKVLMRSELWQETYRQDRPGFPTMGTMLNDQLGRNQPVETQEEMVKRYEKDL